MEIESLREFAVIAESLSLSEAADKLFVSQSTLSRHLQQLERSLGAPLFYRTSRRLEISQYGELLLPYARQIVGVYDEGRQKISGQLRRERQLLVVGSLPAVTEYPIGAALGDFREWCPDCTIQVLEGESYQLKERLLAGECDLAFVREVDDSDDRFCRIPFWRDRLVAVLPAGHPLAGEERLRLEQLRGELFLTTPEHTVMYDAVRAVCEAAGFTPKIWMQSHHIRTALDMLTHQQCVSICAERTVRCNSSQGEAIVPLEPETETQINVLYCRENAGNPALRQFYSFLRERFGDG